MLEPENLHLYCDHSLFNFYQTVTNGSAMFKYCTVGFMLFDGKHFFENVLVQSDVLTQKVKFNHTLTQ